MTTNNLTAAQAANLFGLDSLAQVERATGVQRRTLENWYKGDKRLQFVILLLGCCSFYNIKKPTKETYKKVLY